ncbi:GIY-YIG nuclease family protein [Corynebacterium striatum]|nr:MULTISPECIES: GIY-YIG nuclease family protein [Corynebacterium]NHY11091.1 GIY-YIG nuclease family protein [Corynebacterium striatum]NHY35428.1 GIY-YIG nuclease family protein [Corynebacterium striatum]PIS59538.1 hypothetical protein AZH45_02180 [Corynebacterium striatum]PIS63272.1 hypothetical protein AZH47_04155 [Corynebacterium striatum]PXY10138.1 hypothetical protein CKF72_05735 [Corynebacterium striatum]
MTAFSLNFKRWEIDSNSPVAPLVGTRFRRGIYILEFTNGERYVGLTENIVQRFRTHAHGSKHHPAWTDISALRFARVPQKEALGPLEQTMIAEQLNERQRLRNRTFNFDSNEHRPLDFTISVEEQQHWIQETWGREAYNFSEFPNLGPLPSPKVQRSTDAATYAKILADLSFALSDIIPLAPDTEKEFWTLTDLPSTNSNSRYAAINTGVVEMLVLHNDEFYPEVGVDHLPGPSGYLNVSPGDEDTNDFITAMRKAKKPGQMPIQFSVLRYKPIEAVPVFYPLGKLSDVMHERPELLQAAREFAVKNMRYRNGGLFRRFHSRALTDAVYQHLIDVGETTKRG